MHFGRRQWRAIPRSARRAGDPLLPDSPAQWEWSGQSIGRRKWFTWSRPERLEGLPGTLHQTPIPSAELVNGPRARSGPVLYPRVSTRRLAILYKARPKIANFWGLGVRIIGNVWRRRGYEVVLGRQQRRVLHCADLGELRFVVMSTYVGSQVLPSLELGESVERLHELGRLVRNELRTRFIQDGTLQRSTGGWPGFKEIALYALIRRYRPENVVETGVAQGVSSSFILDALHQNGSGHLTSVDLPNHDPAGLPYREHGHRDAVFVKPSLGVGWIVPGALRKNWTLLIGPSQDLLPTLNVMPQLFLHDSLHTRAHMAFEFDWAWSRLPIGGFVVADDIGWNTAFPDFVTSRKPNLEAICSKGVGIAVRVR